MSRGESGDGCGKGCLIAVVVVLGLVVGGGLYIYNNFIGIMASQVYQAIVMQIEDSNLPEAEKQGLIKQFDRVKVAVTDGDIDQDQMNKLFEELEKSKIMPMAGILLFETSYVDASGLVDEKKTEVKLQAQRFARGVFEKKITEDEADAIFKDLSVPDPDDPQNSKLKDSLTDEELTALSGRMKALCDQHSISNEPFKIDLSGELKKVLDKVLGAAK